MSDISIISAAYNWQEARANALQKAVENLEQELTASNELRATNAKKLHDISTTLDKYIEHFGLLPLNVDGDPED